LLNKFYKGNPEKYLRFKGKYIPSFDTAVRIRQTANKYTEKDFEMKFTLEPT
jgi:hypothetical protein